MIELAQAGHGNVLFLGGILLQDTYISKRNFAHFSSYNKQNHIVSESRSILVSWYPRIPVS